MAQSDWKWCNKCQGLFFGGNGTLGACPTGGGHSDAGSGDYVVPTSDSASSGQSNWRWCYKCQGLFFAGSSTPSVCPFDSKPHTGGTTDYVLVFQDGQDNWRWCAHCQGLFFAGNSTPSVCPVEGHPPHVDAGSGNYVLLTSGESNAWRWCNKCHGLFGFDSQTITQGVCPADGQSHTDVGSGNYILLSSPPAVGSVQSWWGCFKCHGLFYEPGYGPNSSDTITSGVCPAGGPHIYGSGVYYLSQLEGQNNWRWCNKCQGLFFAGNSTLGVCPADHNPHNDSESGNYVLSFG